MAFYEGEPFTETDVVLCGARLDDVLLAEKSPDYASKIIKWATLALTQSPTEV